MKRALYPARYPAPALGAAELDRGDIAHLVNQVARLGAFYVSVQRHGGIRIGDTLALLFFPKLSLIYQLAMRGRP